MVRRIDRVVPGQAVVPRNSIAAIGDSLTHNTTLGVLPSAFYPEQLAKLLQALGVPVRSRNFGSSGATTMYMKTRIPLMTLYDVPILGIVWGGVNDPGNSITGATTQANIVSMGTTLLNGGVGKLLVANTQYLNYTSGGDTTTTPYATYATLRPFQAAAATALATAYPNRVALCDVYGAMRGKIVDGTEVQGSASWHVAGTDQHLNVLGQRYVAEAIVDTITRQTAWLDQLTRVSTA